MYMYLLSLTHKMLSARVSPAPWEGDGEEEGVDKQQEEEEKRIKALMKGMASAGSEDVCKYL